MTRPRACRAKEPALCPKHGRPAQQAEQTRQASLRADINAILDPAPTAEGKFKGTVEAKPLSKNSKQYFAQEVSADTHEELMSKLAQVASDFNPQSLKALRTGYDVRVTFPTSENDPDIIQERGAYGVTEPGAVKTFLEEVPAEAQREHHAWAGVIDTIRSSKEGQTPAGKKGVALMEAMAKFKFFTGDYAKNDVEAAFRSIVKDNATEYTNRGWGVRVHPEYTFPTGLTGKRELRGARFSLDSPGSSWNAFSQEQVDRVNTELNNYFKEVDASQKK